MCTRSPLGPISLTASKPKAEFGTVTAYGRAAPSPRSTAQRALGRLSSQTWPVQRQDAGATSLGAGGGCGVSPRPRCRPRLRRRPRLRVRVRLRRLLLRVRVRVRALGALQRGRRLVREGRRRGQQQVVEVLLVGGPVPARLRPARVRPARLGETLVLGGRHRRCARAAADGADRPARDGGVGGARKLRLPQGEPQGLQLLRQKVETGAVRRKSLLDGVECSARGGESAVQDNRAYRACRCASDRCASDALLRQRPEPGRQASEAPNHGEGHTSG
mmetsp:Transcript_23780/g.80327  ORF Transcript_23780/g.80327 Transcript_23780/m.80327 type:complete len:275 (-) Transcript_23780:7-831(-)